MGLTPVKNKIRRKGAVVLIAALVACALFLVNFLFHRHFIRFDLTADKEYTLAPATKKILKNLDDRITIKLYFTSPLPPDLNTLQQQVNDLLDELRVYSNSKVSIQRVIPEESPQLEQEAQIIGIPPLQLNVVRRDKQEVQKIYLGAAVFYGDKKEVIPVISEASNLEYDLTSSILKLTSPKLPKSGVFLPARVEEDANPYKAVARLLGEQIEVKALTAESKDLAREGLDALLVLEPKDLPPAFVREMDRLLEAGTPVVILGGNVEVSPNLEAASYKTGLEEWLKGKGIEVSQELLIEPKKPARAAFYTGLVNYSIPYPFFVKVNGEGLNQGHPATQELEEVVFPWTNGLTLHSESHPDWKYETLAESSDASFLQDGPPVVNPDVLNQLQIKGGIRHPLVAVVEIPGKEKASRLVIAANSRFVENNFLRDYPNNVLLVQNLMDWLSWGDDLIGIRSRGKATRPLAIPPSSAISLIRWGHVIGIPLLVIAVGLAASWLRKKRHRKLLERYHG